MKTVMTLIAILFSSALTAFCGWSPVGASMTATQKTVFISWVLNNGITEKNFFSSLYQGPQTGWYEWDEVFDRDRLVVEAEGFAKNVAAEAEITKTDTPAQMNTKLKAMINAAATADKPIAVYEANAFWTAYFMINSVDVTADSTVTIHHKDPVYGPNIAETLALPAGLTLQDYEQAITKGTR